MQSHYRLQRERPTSDGDAGRWVSNHQNSTSAAARQ
jgi:hypothetical protein